VKEEGLCRRATGEERQARYEPDQGNLNLPFHRLSNSR